MNRPNRLMRWLNGINMRQRFGLTWQQWLGSIVGLILFVATVFVVFGCHFHVHFHQPEGEQSTVTFGASDGNPETD